jgi:pSer/pThr/pTyr-binding forkhead associated (FHA) protein
MHDQGETDQTGSYESDDCLNCPEEIRYNACLVVLSGKKINKKYSLYNHSPEVDINTVSQTLTLGRSRFKSRLTIDDSLVSRKHAVIIQDGSKFFIDDDGSRNGTWVNNERLVGVIRLHNRDRIRVGTTILKFLQGDLEMLFLDQLKPRKKEQN